MKSNNVSKIDVVSKTVGNGLFTSGTGYCQSVNGVEVFYVIRSVYEKLNRIERKAIENQRKRLEATLPVEELEWYFHNHDGKYYYSDYFQKFRAYKKELSVNSDPSFVSAGDTRPIKTITQLEKPFSDGLKAGLKIHKWSYACCINYQNKLEVDRCVAKVRDAFSQICKKFQTAEVTMYYTTELKDKQNPDGGYHSHMVVSITGPGLIQVQRGVKAILKRCGSLQPWVTPYNCEIGDYVGYISKDVYEVPDGWGIMSTNESHLQAILRATESNGEHWI